MISWKSESSLKRFKTEAIQFRFCLHNGHLYSFWVSEFKTGESGGYTAGGGPGLHPSGVDLPL
jgi:hypothetical protein